MITRVRSMPVTAAPRSLGTQARPSLPPRSGEDSPREAGAEGWLSRAPKAAVERRIGEL